MLRLIHDGVASGAQFVLATRSPILIRADSAAIYELDDTGMHHHTAYDDLTAVVLWRRFLEDPEALLAVLYADED